jgi:elongation factor G
LKVYESSRIRNIAVIGHGSAGKTSLAEAMLFNAGHINRLGKVDDGTATTDYFPEEIKRKISVSTSLAPCEWKDCKINIMDTPGYADFFSEVKGALRVADSVLLVLCAVSGVEVQTEIGWRETEKANLPKVALINKMDRENANFDRVLQQMKDVFKKNIVPIQLPIGSVENFSGIVDILKMKAYKYASSSGEYQEEEIPDEMKAAAESAREELIEAAAEGDDDSKWYFWLVHIVPHCIRQKSGGTRYRCEGRCFSPRACCSLIAKGILDNKDEFSEEEIADIRAALREVARGEWVDFDEFRKSQNL